jgi:microcompartment protein CcmK/EutM
LRQTHYLISNKRVLIQRGREELHLDRRMIVEVIDTPAGVGTRNLFLVLDGPHARALASSGAFGEKTDHTVELVPVFEWVQDGDGARHALERNPPSLPPLPWAA